MTIRWDPGASTDLREAARFLNQRQRGLGKRLRKRVDEAIKRIQGDPASYENVEANIHRCNVKQFPYSVYYQVRSDNSVIIFAIAHHSRRFGYWQHRIPSDDETTEETE